MMRKALVLFVLLLACGAGGVTYAALTINPARGQVELTETTLYGDAAAAEGLIVESKAHYSNRLFWDTTHVVGAEPDSWTEFSVFEKKVSEAYDNSPSGVTAWSYVDRDLDSFYNVQDMESWKPQGLGIAMKELWAEVQPGQEKSRTIHLADYYDYYPLDVTIDLPGYYFFTDYEGWQDFDKEYAADQRAVYQAFTDFFRIPVLENEEHEIHVSKNESGLLHSWGSGTAGDGPFFQMNVFSTVAEGACYFTFDACASDGETVVDTSLIPGGYGIYRLNWGYEGEEAPSEETILLGDESAGWIDESSLEMVYPLEPGIGWEYFEVSEDGSRLYLITEKDGTCTLTVIDTATMETLQQLELVTFGEDGGSISHVYREDDFWLVRISDGQIALLRDDNGLLELQFLADYNPRELPEYSLSYYTTATDWNGERLAIVTEAYDEQYEAEWGYSARYGACAYCIAVYDESGEMLYCGRYDTSLKPTGLAPSEEGCAWFGQTTCPFTVHWGW